MTKRIEKSPTTEGILRDCRELVCNPHSSNETKIQAVTIAFNIGLSKGRVDGAQEMGEHMLSSIPKPKPAAVPA